MTKCRGWVSGNWTRRAPVDNRRTLRLRHMPEFRSEESVEQHHIIVGSAAILDFAWIVSVV
ncbi:hypothetical protein [Paenibacillus sp. URB8-2]|uniref:hypothetical protein n=1 Tax=Paenibacillus sp. URB8-2 TaxID=2741301 RepID=UPI0015B89D1B|nr:hypothetical protein [Paenibacillus sp. URB8-2]